MNLDDCPMTNQILKYYCSRKDKLLIDFDRTFALLNDWLIARYGKELTNKLQEEARLEYAKLIPEIPYIKAMSTLKVELIKSLFF